MISCLLADLRAKARKDHSATMSPSYQYSSISDVKDVEMMGNKLGGDEVDQPQAKKERTTYELSPAFKILSGTVWASFSVWGVWIAAYYGGALSRRDWNAINIVFPDLYSPEFSTAAIAIGIHLVGAAFMAIAGAFQLVKYVRKEYPVFHRWVGRCYIVASMLASIGGVFFIFAKGSYGGRQADIGFAAYGIVFFICGVMTYAYAYKRDFNSHKLWAWRLYSLSLASWLWRFDYYWIEVLFGTTTSWMHNESFRGIFDYFENWAFWVPGLIVVEIIFRWGESASLPCAWLRWLDIGYGVVWVLSVIFSFHAAIQLWIPSVAGTYDSDSGWIL